MKYIKLTLKSVDTKEELSIDDVKNKVEKEIKCKVLEIYGASTQEEIECACERSW